MAWSVFYQRQQGCSEDISRVTLAANGPHFKKNAMLYVWSIEGISVIIKRKDHFSAESCEEH